MKKKILFGVAALLIAALVSINAGPWEDFIDDPVGYCNDLCGGPGNGCYIKMSDHGIVITCVGWRGNPL